MIDLAIRVSWKIGINHEETLLSVLADAGLPLQSGIDTYVTDVYFQAEDSDQDRDGDALRLEFDVVDDIRRKKIREEYNLWTAVDMPEDRYRIAKIRTRRKSTLGSNRSTRLIPSSLHPLRDSTSAETILLVVTLFREGYFPAKSASFCIEPVPTPVGFCPQI
ncbi:hypothetical protein [Halostagnicola kamekurae]|uniref:hypothetical protein n=1 Tax=Halostagnicola kamekurae TaxID=619731 RepID=UPI00111450D7|nr:hypothetical protein [Halostagnicola kamekurae]